MNFIKELENSISIIMGNLFTYTVISLVSGSSISELHYLYPIKKTIRKKSLCGNSSIFCVALCIHSVGLCVTLTIACSCVTVTIACLFVSSIYWGLPNSRSVLHPSCTSTCVYFLFCSSVALKCAYCMCCLG